MTSWILFGSFFTMLLLNVPIAYALGVSSITTLIVTGLPLSTLRSDSDVIAAYAKKMGFVRDGERLVKISGISETPAFVYDPGTRVMRPEIIFVPEWIAKSIAFLIFILYNLAYSLLCVLYRYDTAKI